MANAPRNAKKNQRLFTKSTVKKRDATTTAAAADTTAAAADTTATTADPSRDLGSAPVGSASANQDVN